MFITLNDAILDSDQLSPREKLILLAIGRHMNKDGDTAFPSMRTIAAVARCGMGSVHRAVQALIARGFLVLAEKGHQRRSSRYTIPIVMFQYVERNEEKLCSIQVELSVPPIGTQRSIQVEQSRPSNHPSNREREENAPATTRLETKRRILEEMGAVTKTKGADLMSEWLAATKGIKLDYIATIFRESVPGIQWPSEFKARRNARVSY